MKRFAFSVIALALLAMTAYAGTAEMGTLEALKAGHTRNENTLDNVGDVLRTITVPVASPSGVGVSIAADCRGNLYYTNTFEGVLYKIDAMGNLLSSMPILGVPGTPNINIDEMSWDEGRQLLWGAEYGTYGIYLIDPVTGQATFQFTGMGGIQLTDGLAYDPSDGTVWHSTDVSSTIEHFSATGLYLGSLTPLDASGLPQGTISGITVGTGNTMYVGHNGQGVITRVDKSTGAFISTFAVVGGRDEGMECDPVTFAPRLVLWVKGAYDGSVTAIEVDNGTCACAVLPDTCNPAERFPYTEVDLGDLVACNYPTLRGNPAHGLSGIAWLGAGITAEGFPHIFNADGADDGVNFLGLPWTPCTAEQVQVTVTAGQHYTEYDSCGGQLYLNAWKDGNLDGDFCDELCEGRVSEWIIKDVLVNPGVVNLSVMDPGVLDYGVYAGIFRFRLTSQPIGRFGYGGPDAVACPLCTCPGTFGQDYLGEVEDYYIPDAQLAVELSNFSAVAEGAEVRVAWTTASETDNARFELFRNNELVASVLSQGNTATGHDYSYTDVTTAGTYNYTLVAVDVNNERRTLGTREVTSSGSNAPAVITEYTLHQNYPNPFNPTTSIMFDLVEAGNVNLKVFNAVGQQVATLVSAPMSAGSHTVSFNASGMPSGIYFYRLEANGYVAHKKMLLMK